ncbi:MAG: DUF6311 domain-containing protein [Dehalococcoidia bacterium]|nr:DUF6311 domain-containing protein [Dehalococcoidia bacterium]
MPRSIGAVAIRALPQGWLIPVVALDRVVGGVAVSLPARLALGGGIGFAVGLWVLGPWLLDPTATAWMAIGDRLQHYVGWVAFRDAPWSWPIGHIDRIIHPTGAMIAYTDSIPIVATVFKIVEPLLPEQFQYFGWWLFAAYALSGVFGVLVARLFTDRWLCQLAAAALMALSPSMMQRLSHEALTAHWLVIAALWLALRPVHQGAATFRWWHWAALLGFTGGVHPYLVMMTAPFAVASWLLVVIEQRRVRSILAVAPILGAPLATLWMFGYFTVRGVAAEGFGHYSADLLTFIAPQGFSRFLPEWSLTAGQREGMAYLGAGTLALAAVAVGALVRRPPSRRFVARSLPLLTAVAGLTPLAVTGTVRVNGAVIADLDGLVRAFPLPVDVFRASGRLIWPLQYLIVIGVVASVATRLPFRFAAAAMLAAVSLQVVDVGPGVEEARTSFNWSLEEATFDPAFAEAHRHYHQITLIPPHYGESGCEVSPDGDGGTRRVMLLAAVTGVPTNSGVVARMDQTVRDVTCWQSYLDLDAGNLPPDRIYLPHPKYRRDLVEAFDGPMVCGSLNRFTICVDDRVASPLRDRLKASQAADQRSRQ